MKKTCTYGTSPMIAKTYIVLSMPTRVKSNSLIWMDANSIIHTKIPIELLNDLTGDSIFISCVGKSTATPIIAGIA